MRIYDALSRVALTRKKYAVKFLLVAFAGIHIPLIGMCVFFLCSAHVPPVAVVVIVLLLLTLTASVVTLYVQNKLLTPLLLARKSLDEYIATRQVPQMPVHYEDEAGVLMRSIQATIEKLEEGMQEKATFIDLVSHDLRSPVARISGLAHVLKFDEAENHDLHLDNIIRECSGLMVLLQHILATLKQEAAAETNFAAMPVHLKELVLSCTISFDFKTTKKNIRWIVDIDEQLALSVEPVLFLQVVKNLLSNAIKFSPSGKPVRITARTDGQWLLLAIRDEGMGFDPADSEKIFQRFTSAGKTGTQGELSTGLGLFLSRKIIERHGGNILAECEGPGMGATFTIILPYAPSAN